MKIYIIPAWYPQNDEDICASFFREQAHALADRGHKVTVLHISPISVTRLFRQPYHTRRVWHDGNVRTIYHEVIVPIPAKTGRLQDNYISKMFHRIIAAEIKKDETDGHGRPNILHAHVSHTCAYYCLEASKKLHIPLVVTEHYSGLLLGTATEREYQRVHDTIEGADAFVFVGSNFQKTLCEKLNIRKKTYVIPNMVDTSLFNAYKANKEKSERPFSFLTSCHLKKHKSVDLIIRAFHDAFLPDECVRLLIAGDGEERRHLEQLVEILNENTRVSFFGRYTREEAPEIFLSADAFVLTSQVEPFGIVYIEAMMAGLPCIGTKGQGADDIITDDNGVLVDYGEVGQLARVMKRVKEDAASYNAGRIRSQCVRQFSPDVVCDLLEDVYESVKEKI